MSPTMLGVIVLFVAIFSVGLMADRVLAKSLIDPSINRIVRIVFLATDVGVVAFLWVTGHATTIGKALLDILG